ncbi:MAG TPA: class I SAM-dependent methyltransferase [Capillimicrobium sp.]|jgi:hypothetical protein
MFLPNSEMSYGEQATLEGILAMATPSTSVEIGTYTGGSLRRIAGRSGHVHTFDLVSHVTERLPNVAYHLGDSATTVPALLRRLHAEGTAVDFAFVDGDHARDGVRRDALSLLDSPAVVDTIIVFHDIANEGVRAGVQDALAGRDDLAFVDLSFAVPASTGRFLAESWGGLGLVVVDKTGSSWKLPRQRLPNADWRTTTQRGPVWRASAPARAAKRAAGYRVRPLIRRVRGVRGRQAPGS